MPQISTYIINLEKRKDRKAHIQKQFENKPEFNVQMVKAIENENGALGLWQTIIHIIKDLTSKNEEYILICEDDHQFTDEYNKEKLFEYIEEARTKNADLLSGGPSWFNTALPISENLFWVEQFSGFQFTIIFQKFFNIILTANFTDFDAADLKMAELSNNTFFNYPFLSVQKDFGYSDATLKNNKANKINELFEKSQDKVNVICKLSKYFNDTSDIKFDKTLFQDISIPTYVINLPKRIDRKKHIIAQFNNRSEFEVIIVEACKNEIGALGLWESIRKIVKLAIANDDDVIIICEDDHTFTANYNPDLFIRNIFEAHHQNCDLLVGGVGNFNLAIPISSHRFWLDYFWSSQFVVLYKKIFNAIIDEEYDETITADDKFSEIATSKMVIHPFISIQQEFGYSDITTVGKRSNLDEIFSKSASRLDLIKLKADNIYVNKIV